MLKGFKENMAGGAKYPATGADDNQGQAFGRLVTVTVAFEGSEHLLGSVEVAVRAVQNNQLNVDITRFCARMLQAIISGQSIQNAFAAAKAGMADGDEEVRKAVQRVEANLGRSAHEMLMEIGKEVKPDFPALGLTCHNPYAFMGSLHTILTATSFEGGLHANLLTGGDNCSRATLVGAMLGAAFGVPQKLDDKVDMSVRVQV